MGERSAGICAGIAAVEPVAKVEPVEKAETVERVERIPTIRNVVVRLAAGPLWYADPLGPCSRSLALTQLRFGLH